MSHYPWNKGKKTDTLKLVVLWAERPGGLGPGEYNPFDDLVSARLKVDNPPCLAVEHMWVGPANGGGVPKRRDFDDTDGVIIVGGATDCDAPVNEPWVIDLVSFLKEFWVHRRDLLFFGLGVGHQILARVLGGTIGPVGPAPTDPWKLSSSPITLSDVGARIIPTPPGDQIHTLQFHRYHVVFPPSAQTADNGLLEPNTSVEIWGWSPNTPIQGLHIPDKLFTSQGIKIF